MGNYDSIDLDFTWDGDYIVGADGDLGDTSDDYVRSIETEIATVVKSDLLDWEMDPTLGATLSDYVGEPNTRDTAQLIEDRVRSQLVNSGLINAGDLTVRVVPLNIHRVMIAINVLTLSTANNRLETGNPISVNIVFDTTEHSVFVVPPYELNQLYP